MVSQFGRYVHLVSASQMNHLALQQYMYIYRAIEHLLCIVSVYYTAASEHF